MSEISAQPHITLCIQFLNREKMTKTGKTDLFYNSMGLYGNFTRSMFKTNASRNKL